MPVNRKFQLTAGGFLAFFIFGFVDNLKGPLLPEMIRGGDLSYSKAGTVFLFGYIGFILSTLGCGVLADKISHRGVLLLSAMGLCIGGLGFSSTSSYLLLITFMFVIGLGLGAIELGGNGLMVELHTDHRGRYLNLLGTFHGLGSLTVPMFAAVLLEYRFSWQLIYCSSAVLAIPLAAVLSRSAENGKSKLQSETTVGLVREKRLPDRTGLFRAAFTMQMGLYYLLLSPYVALELGVGAWMMEYLQRVRSMSVANSSFFLSSFFVLLMLGRLFGAFVVDAVGHNRAVAFSLIGSCICLTIGVLASASLVFFIPLSGLFMSIAFPTLTASVSEIHKENTGSILGILFAFSGVGGAIGPWAIGITSDEFGIAIGFACSLVFGVVAIATLAILKRQSHAI